MLTGFCEMRNLSLTVSALSFTRGVGDVTLANYTRMTLELALLSLEIRKYRSGFIVSVVIWLSSRHA